MSANIGTVPGAVELAGDLTQSAFSGIVEKIAPGFCKIVDGSRRNGEPWPDALENNLMFINATDEQRALLMRLAKMARDGLAPPSFEALTGGESEPVDWVRIAAITSIAWIAFQAVKK